MIISCPECAGPFEVPDDRIAALVQVACPHCAFRMILDFAAANDPGLVEQGMRMASGFRSAADYHQSVQLAAAPVEAAEATTGEPAFEVVAPIEAEPVRAEPPARVRPEPAARPEPPVRARPEPVAPAEPPVRARPEPVSPAVGPPRPLAPTPTREPVRPAAEVRPVAAEARPVSEEARTEVHMLPRGAERLVPLDIPPVRRAPVPRPDEEDIAVKPATPATEIVRTVVGPPPTASTPDEVAIDFDDEDEQETTTDQPPLRTPEAARRDAAHPVFGSDEDEDVPTMVVTPDTRESAQRDMDAAMAARRPRPEAEAGATPASRERPRPPHTPPGRAKVTARDEEAATASDRGERPVRPPEADVTTLPPATEPMALDDELEQERMSTFGVVVVVLLLLLAGSLIGASIALNDDHGPDPRPLLQKLYRQYIKGEPAVPTKAETKPEPAPEKRPAGDPPTGEGTPPAPSK